MDVYTTEQYSQDPIYYTQLMQKQANEWSAEQAQKQMDFQKYMSDTAHQREVADLHAAGLNPVLSAHTNGASTPNGSSATADTSGMSVVADLMSQLIAADTAKSLAARGGGGYGGSGYNPYYFKDGWMKMLEDFVEGAFDMPAQEAVKKAGKWTKDYLTTTFPTTGVGKLVMGMLGLDNSASQQIDNSLDAAAQHAAQSQLIPKPNSAKGANTVNTYRSGNYSTGGSGNKSSGVGAGRSYRSRNYDSRT